MGNWAPFWFETNSAFGMVDSPEAWAAMRARWNKGAHGMKPDDIYSSNLSLDRVVAKPDDVPNFGRRSEHLGGKTTLGEFFDANGLDRDIGSGLTG